VLKKELLQYLRSKRTIRRSKHAPQKGSGHGQIKDMISNHERPRKTLQFETPAEKFNACVVSTG